MKKLAGLLFIGLMPLIVNAQEAAPKTVDVGFYGEASYDCAGLLAEVLGVELALHGLDEDTLNTPCWAVRPGATHQQAVNLFATAAGCNARLGENTLHLYAPGEPVGGTKVKGYDVSVLCGRFVEYVNTYGAPKSTPRPGDTPREDRTAAEHLADVVEDVMYTTMGADVEPSVVGDRLLLTLPEESHTRVRELLDLLVGEGGGESATLKGEAEAFGKLRTSSYKAEAERTPIASVLTGIARAAGLGLVLGASFADVAIEEHIDFAVEAEGSALDALNRLVARLAQQDMPVVVIAREGALIVESAGWAIGTGYRVYDIADLLKKLEASYQRQRTAPGKDEGFTGDLRNIGGNGVVLGSLEKILSELSLTDQPMCIGYGTKVIVRGSRDTVDRATEVLKEMGWEPPKE